MLSALHPVKFRQLVKHILHGEHIHTVPLNHPHVRRKHAIPLGIGFVSELLSQDLEHAGEDVNRIARVRTNHQRAFALHNVGLE